MGIKYKFKLLEKEIALINETLTDSQVTFTFEDVKDYVIALQKIAPVMHESYHRYLKFIGNKKYEEYSNPSEEFLQEYENTLKMNKWIDTCIMKGEEYLVTDDMKLIASGRAYPYRFHDCCPIKKASECSDIVRTIFEEIGIGDCIFDYWNSEYGFVYLGDGSDDIIESVYLTLNPNLLDRTSTEEKQLFYEYLAFDSAQIDFICSNDSNSGLSYIGFNTENKITKYGIKFVRSEFFDKNPSEYYKDYFNIKQVITCLEEGDTEKNINMQFVPGKPKAFAIESQVTNQEYKKETKKLVDYGIITERQAEMLSMMPIDNCLYTVFKYKWSNEDKFQFKVYYIQDPS
mgnify:CR=1 FL=1